MGSPASNLQVNLVALMNKRGLTMKSLGKLAGIAPNTVANYCKGGGTAKLAHLEQLAKALNVTVADLIGDAAPLKSRALGEAEEQLLADLALLPERSVLIDNIHQKAEYARAVARLAQDQPDKEGTVAQAASAAAFRPAQASRTAVEPLQPGDPRQTSLAFFTPAPDPWTAEPVTNEAKLYVAYGYQHPLLPDE